MRAFAELPLLGDEVHVFHHDHRRLQRPRHRAGLGDQAQRLPREQHHRDPGQLTEQVADRVGLAGAGRAVQQDASLEVLAAGEQPAGVPGDPEHLPLDAVKYVRWQDHLLAGDLWPGLKAQQGAAVILEHLAAELDDVAAEHVMGDAHAPDVIDGPLGPPGAVGHRLDGDALPRTPLVGAPDQQHDRALGIGDQVERALHAGERDPARPGGQRVRGNAAQAQTRLPGAGLDQIGQPEHAMVEAGEPRDLMLAAGFGEPRIQAGLDVHVVVARPQPAGHRQSARLPAEVVSHQVPDRGILGPGDVDHLPQQAPGEPADVGELGAIAALGQRLLCHRNSPARRRIPEPAAASHAARIGARCGVSASVPGRPPRCSAGRAARRPPRRRAGRSCPRSLPS